MPVKWKDTQWGDPLDPEYEAKRKARMSRKQRLAEKQREDQEYEEAKVALAMGAATLNEKALLAHAAKAMFDCAHKGSDPEEGDCIAAGLAAIHKLVGAMPISLDQYEEKLTDLWRDGHESLSERVRARRFPHSTLHQRLSRWVERKFKRVMLRDSTGMRFTKRGASSHMLVSAKFQRTAPPVIDAVHPQTLEIGTDWVNEQDTTRFGRGTLVLRTDRENPGHYWLLVHKDRTVEKKVVYVKDITKLGAKRPRYQIINGEEK